MMMTQAFTLDGHEGPEENDDRDARIEKTIRELLVLLGEDPNRRGLEDTPRRVRRAWREWTRGYEMLPSQFLSHFEHQTSNGSELIVVNGNPVYSHCEHHLTPFFGVAHIGYLPDGKIIGLSKVPRVVSCFAARLQVQERLTAQIAEAINDCLQPRGVAVTLTCRHLCMESRGIRSVGSMTTTSTYLGLLKTSEHLRAEFVARTT